MPAPRPKSGLLTHALAGLHAGIVGVIWMFACFAVAALLEGGGIWSIPNLFSTTFYGDFAYQPVFLRSTWAGLALIIVLYGLMGAIWGCVWKEHRKALLSFYGALTGLAVYYLFFNVVWVHLSPLIPLYAPVRQLQVAHILWGAALARSPGYSKRISAAMTPSVSAVTQSAVSRATGGVVVVSGAPAGPAESGPARSGPMQPTTGQDDAESVSGELIQ